MKYVDLRPGDLLVTRLSSIDNVPVNMAKMVISAVHIERRRSRSYDVQITWLHLLSVRKGVSISCYSTYSALKRDTCVIRHGEKV